MTEMRSVIGERIKAACNLAGVKLKPGCNMAGVNYDSLYTQIRFNREIPATTVFAFAEALGFPIAFFFPQTNADEHFNPIHDSSRLAQQVNLARSKVTRAGFDVSTDHILDWYREQNGQLSNWEWFADQVDLYAPIQPEDKIMRPIQFGENSITTERLMLNSIDDYYQTVGTLAQKRLSDAMDSHRAIKHQNFIVTEEKIDEILKGQRVRAGYRKVTMRVSDKKNQPITAVFSKLTWLSTQL